MAYDIFDDIGIPQYQILLYLWIRDDNTFHSNWGYNEGEMILNDNILYKAKTSFISGETFSSSDWTQVPYKEWKANQSYSKDEYVFTNNILYQAKEDLEGASEFNKLDFQQIITFNTRRFIMDISNILTSDLDINKERNTPDDCSFSVEYVQFKKRLEDEGTFLPNVLKPWLTEIKVRRNFKTVFDGYLYTMKLSLGEINEQRLEFKCFDWSKMLEKRFVSFGIGSVSYPEIAMRVMEEAQHELNWIENYAFEASDDEAYLSTWAYNGSFEDPDPKIRVASGERLWGGGISLPANTYMIGPTQSAEDYNGEKLYFSCYHRNNESTTLTLSFYEGPLSTATNAGTLIGTKTITLPATPQDAGSIEKSWVQTSQYLTGLSAGKIHYIKISTNKKLDLSELQLYRAPVVGDIYDLGISRGIFDPSYTSSSGEQKEYKYQTDRIRHFHQQEALEGIFNLSKLKADESDGDQFEFVFDEDKKLNIWKYQGKTIADPDLQLTYPGDIKTLDITRDIEDVTNCIYGSSEEEIKYKDAEGNEKQFVRKWSAVLKDPDSLKNMGAMESITSYEGVNSQTDIDSKIGADLNSYGDIQEMPTLSVDSNIYNPSNLHIGDAIALKVLEDDLFTFINGIYRIYSYSLSVSTDSVENMSFTLISPTFFTLQMMSFVQRYKLTESQVRRLQAR